MNIKIVVNDFGRIRRLVLRRIIKTEGIEVVAVNDLASVETLPHLFKYDSTQDRFQGTVELKEDTIVVDGREIKVFARPNPEELPQGELGIDVVLEYTSFFTSKAGAEAHIRTDVRKVVISAPGGNDVKTIVYDMSQNMLDGSETVTSTASCTTNCLAPTTVVLQHGLGIAEGLVTTIHAFTGDQNTLDVPHRKDDLRRTRAVSPSIVPDSTGAAKAISLVIPELNGKLDGSARRVSVAAGSLTELVSVLKHSVTKEEINVVMKTAVNESYGYTEEQLVSSDVVGTEEGSLFGTIQTYVMNVDDKRLVRTVVWHNNEMPYAHQLVRTLKHSATKIQFVLVVDN